MWYCWQCPPQILFLLQINQLCGIMPAVVLDFLYRSVKYGLVCSSSDPALSFGITYQAVSSHYKYFLHSICGTQCFRLGFPVTLSYIKLHVTGNITDCYSEKQNKPSKTKKKPITLLEYNISLKYRSSYLVTISSRKAWKNVINTVKI